MKRKGLVLCFAGLMILLMACNLSSLQQIVGGENDGQGGSATQPGSEAQGGAATSPGSPPSQGAGAAETKKFDGELTITDQWWANLQDGRVDYALIVKNSSPTLTVTNFTQTGSLTDASGNPVAITNISSPDSGSNINVLVYPGARQLVCLSYGIAKGAKVGKATFGINKQITAADFKTTQNPLKVESQSFLEKTKMVNAVGDVLAKVTNQTDKDVIFTEFEAAAFDANGKLIGCGISFNTYSFMPAKATLPIQFSIIATAKPSKVELFASSRDSGAQRYSGPEPVQVSDVKFVQVRGYFAPIYTLKNTGKGAVLDYLRNIIVFGQNDELLYLQSGRMIGGDFPPGFTYGPYFGSHQLNAEKPVSRVEVQIHTMEVRDRSTDIKPDSVTFGLGTYNAEKLELTAQAKNNLNRELKVNLGVGCLDASGNLIGAGVGTAKLPANAETTVKASQVSWSFKTDSTCANASQIIFNIASFQP